MLKLTELNKDLAGTVIGASNLGSPGSGTNSNYTCCRRREDWYNMGAVYIGVNANGKFSVSMRQR